MRRLISLLLSFILALSLLRSNIAQAQDSSGPDASDQTSFAELVLDLLEEELSAPAV